MGLRRGYPAWLAAERRGPAVGPGMRQVIEAEWLRGNLDLQWATGDRESQQVRHDLGFAFPMDSEAIGVEFGLPRDYVVSDRFVGPPGGVVALAGGRTTQRLGTTQQRLRDSWWHDWRAAERPRTAVDFEPEPVTGDESTWRLLDHEVWLLARPGADGPTFFPEPGQDGAFVTAVHNPPGPGARLPAHHHWRVAALRDVVRLLPAGTGILLDPATATPRRFSADEVALMGRRAVAFPDDAAITWAPARPSWLVRLQTRELLDKLAADDALARLWVAGYQVEDADQQVVLVYETAAGVAGDDRAERRLADAVYRAASELRRCYRVAAATLSAVPDEGRAWLAGQQPVLG